MPNGLLKLICGNSDCVDRDGLLIYCPIARLGKKIISPPNKRII